MYVLIKVKVHWFPWIHSKSEHRPVTSCFGACDWSRDPELTQIVELLDFLDGLNPSGSSEDALSLQACTYTQGVRVLQGDSSGGGGISDL